jgi:uncharacterized protein (TIGR02677 family)
MRDVNEAHRLSSLVFGVSHTKHLFAEEKRTENIYADIWEEEPTELIVKPRIRQYREKAKPTAIPEFSLEKMSALNEYVEQKEAEQRMIEQYIEENTIVFSRLPVIEAPVRKMLLSWVGKAMARKDKTVKIETGRVIKVILLDDHFIHLQSEDGTLLMPNFQIQFLPEKETGG